MEYRGFLFTTQVQGGPSQLQDAKPVSFMKRRRCCKRLPAETSDGDHQSR